MSNNFTTRAVVQGRNITGLGHDEQVTVSLVADYHDGRNKEWAKYTPYLDYKVTVKPEIAEGIKNGDKYEVTFRKIEPEVVLPPVASPVVEEDTVEDHSRDIPPVASAGEIVDCG